MAMFHCSLKPLGGPHKGNGVVVLDKLAYNNALSDLLSDDTKFKNCNLI